MGKTEFIRWYRSIGKPAYMNDLKLSEVWDEIYEAGYENGRLGEAEREDNHNEPK